MVEYEISNYRGYSLTPDDHIGLVSNSSEFLRDAFILQNFLNGTVALIWNYFKMQTGFASIF